MKRSAERFVSSSPTPPGGRFEEEPVELKYASPPGSSSRRAAPTPALPPPHLHLALVEAGGEEDGHPEIQRLVQGGAEGVHAGGLGAPPPSEAGLEGQRLNADVHRVRGEIPGAAPP